MNEALEARLARVTAARAECAEREPARFEDTQEWHDGALAVVRRLALERETFTVADVVGKLPKRPTDLRAVGPVLIAAVRQGICSADGWQSGGRRRHSRQVRVWRSRIYAGAGP